MTKLNFAFLMIGWMAGLGSATSYQYATREKPVWYRTYQLPADNQRIDTIHDTGDELIGDVVRRTESKPREAFRLSCSLFKQPRAD